MLNYLLIFGLFFLGFFSFDYVLTNCVPTLFPFQESAGSLPACVYELYIFPGEKKLNCIIHRMCIVDIVQID